MRLKTFLKNFRDRLRGLPPISRTAISKELIRQLVDKESPTILEIGCNDGMHTQWFLEIFDNPKIYCFEPDPRAIARFRENIDPRPNVRLFEMALGDRNGEVTFYQSGGHRNDRQAETLPEGWDYSGSIRPPKNHLQKFPWVTFEQQITVPVATLDSWRQQQGVETIDFIWMDVQGAEVDVIRGGMETLAKTRFIYSEYSNHELYEGQLKLRGVLKYLRNFQVMVRYPADILLRNRKLTVKTDLPPDPEGV